jgi:hypothetical protein
MLQQSVNSFASSKGSGFCSSSLRRRRPTRSSANDERELSLRHLQQVLKELEKATEVQERASARLRASIERGGNAAQKPARLSRLDFIWKRLASVRDARIEIEREIEGLRAAT